MRIVAVDGRAWTPDVLSEQVQAAKGATAPIEITVQQGDVLRTLKVSYHEGERYPHLERDAARPDLLTSILAPKSW
jgi:hypothetical protein